MHGIASTRSRQLQLRTTALLFTTLAGLGCANDVADKAHGRHVAKETEDYRHTGGRNLVGKDTAEFMHNYGYTIASESDDVLISQWQATHEGTRDRLFVTLRGDTDELAVRIDRETQQQLPPRWAPLSSTRDESIEAAVFDSVYPGKRDSMSAGDISEYEYVINAQILWQATLLELEERDHWVSSADAPVNVTSASEWMLDKGTPQRRTRYEVMIESTGGSRHRLKIRRAVERAAGPREWQVMHRRRDPKLELALIAVRDATRAAEIETAAQEEAQRAFVAARDAGLLSCGVR